MFGENIKMIRESKDIGLNELSRLSGVNASYISALERDEKKNPSVTTLNKLANALGVAVDDIMKSEPSVYSVMGNVSSIIKEEAESFDIKEFKTAEAAMQYILKQPAIMGFGGFHPEDLSDKDIIEFANELLEQYKNLSYKYKFKTK